MHTWRTHLVALLRRLRKSHAETHIDEIGRILAGVLDAQSVHFQRPDGTPLPPDTTLGQLIEQPFLADIVVAGEVIVPAAPSATGPAPGSRFQPEDVPAAELEAAISRRIGVFIREFARLEHSHEFMWAGFIVRELLPRCGFPPDEAKQILDRLCDEGVLRMCKVPNPKNPKFPATGVQLNHDHPQVQTAVEATASQAQDSPAGPPGVA